MTVAAVSMVKDEIDILPRTLRNMLYHVDVVIVADNMSTDGTREWLRAEVDCYRGRLVVVDDTDPAYRQSAKMSGLARLAALEHGADWIVPFDADEMWLPGAGTISATLEGMPTHIDAVAASLFDHVAVGPENSLEWRSLTALAMPKVAARARPDLVIEQGNHSVTIGGKPPRMAGGLTVHHFPYRSADQFVRKVRNGAAAYAAGGKQIRADFGAHWRQWGTILERDGEEAVRAIFRKWYHRDRPAVPFQIDGEWLNALVWDPVL